MNAKWSDLISVFAIVISLLSFLPGRARAQYAVDKPVDSIRAPASIGAIWTASVQLEAVSATTGKLGLVGTAVKAPFDLVKDAVLFADIPGNKTTALTASAVRLTMTGTGGVGWEQVSAWSLRVLFDAPQSIAPGQKMGCRYDMPFQTFDSFNPLTLTITWTPAGTGRLRCQPGVLASTISAYAPTPVPVPAPAPAPAPTPQPKAGQSPVWATCPTVCPLVDKSGVAWKIVGNSVTANGIAIPLPGGYSDSNSLAMQSNGLVRIISPSRGYFCTTSAGVVIDC